MRGKERTVSGWCREHLDDCIFGSDAELRAEHCPEELGSRCTLVHVMLAVHHRPIEVRRRLIAALYPAYFPTGPEATAPKATGAARPPRKPDDA